MIGGGNTGIRAEMVLPCAELDATLVIAGHGLRLRLVHGDVGAAGTIRLWCARRTRSPAARVC